MKATEFPEKLIIVSGKGGVGKSALASAVALQCAADHRTILVTMDGADRSHPFFELPFTYEPVELAPNLWGINLDGLSAIREYVQRKVPFSGFYTTFLKSRMFKDFARAAPGFQELMSLGKIYDLVTSSSFERIVFDAPATGHLKTLLDVPAATLAAVQVGPLNHNARKIQDMLLNPERTRLLLAALPEEMAIREALELLEFCRARRIQAGPVLVNQYLAQRFQADELEALKMLASAAAVGSGLDWGIRAALAEADLAEVQRAALETLAGVRVCLLPRLLTHEPNLLVQQLAQHVDGGARYEY